MRPTIRLQHILWAGFLLPVLVLAAPQKLELLEAGRMQTLTREGQSVRRLVDNVKLRRGETILSCDLAEFYVDIDEAILSGNVNIITPDSRLSGDHARYLGNEDYLELTGNTEYFHTDYHVRAEALSYRMDLKRLQATGKPFLIDSTSILTADTIWYFEADSLGDARGNAFLDNRGDSLQVGSDRLLYFAGRDSLKGQGNSSLIQMDSNRDTLFTIFSDSLALESGYFFAWQNVIMTYGASTGTCEQFTYQADQDLAVMTGNPLFRETEYRLTGDQFNLQIKDGELQSLFIPANARFEQDRSSQDSTFMDWLTGQQMAVYFENGNAREVFVAGMATSYFNVIEEEIYEGSNRASGDSLFIVLSDSSLQHITVVGGSEGVFTPAKDTDVDGPINYQSHTILYDLQRELTILEKSARVDYIDMTLAAGQIGVYWRENLLRAQSLSDSSAADEPVLEQSGQEPFTGSHMVYDLKTQRGKVTAGRTRLDDGNYFGEQLIRVNEDVYFVEDGYYTTCSLEEDPHFFFASQNMKLITDRLIIARPVVLYIADIPIVALPFAVFPQKKGRTSGFIMPGYDYRPGQGGRAIKDLGYYWAMSDYSDFKIMMDYWDQYEELSFRSNLRYKRRYLFNGYVNFSLASRRNALLDPATWSWKLRFKHNQTINPSFTINADGQLNGDARFDRTYSHDQEQRLNTKLHSGINIQKKFDKIGNVSANASYDQDLQVTSRLDETPTALGTTLNGPTLKLPGVSYSLPTRTFLEDGDRWYNDLQFRYSTRLENTRKWTYESIEDPDSLSTGDTLKWRTETRDRHFWNHNMGLSTNGSFLGVLKVNSSISYREGWVFEYQQARTDEDGDVLVDSTGTILTQKTSGLLRRGTFSLSSGLNTKIYGIFPVGVGSLQAIRHTLTPKITLSYTPDFSKEFWGYVERYTDDDGNPITYDPYGSTALGATSTKSALRMNYSLANDFDYKLFRESDSETIKKRFITWSMSGNYDFRKDSLNASDIGSNLQLTLTENLKLNFRGTFEIYKKDSLGQRYNEFRSPRLSNGNVSFNFRLAGHARQSMAPEDTSAADTSGLDSLLQRSALPGERGKGKQVWGASMGFNYSFAQSNPYAEATRRFQLKPAVQLNLSRNWKISYSGNVDLLAQEIVYNRVNISRDLHCWRLSFDWTPSGSYRGFNLVIRPKASQLKDLKVEHRSQRRFSP